MPCFRGQSTPRRWNQKAWEPRKHATQPYPPGQPYPATFRKDKPENRNQKIENQKEESRKRIAELAIFFSGFYFLVSIFLQWTAGELNPDSLGANKVSSLWTSSPCQRSGIRNQESEALLTSDSCFLTPEVIPDGLEPSLPGCGPGRPAVVFAAGPRDQQVAEVGIEPTGCRDSSFSARGHVTSAKR